MKQTKRILSVILCLLMLIAVVPVMEVEAIDSRVEKAIDWAVSIATDNSHGYSQSSRNGPNYDCSSFVSTAFNKGGFAVSGSLNTSTMASAFKNVGFKQYTKGATSIQRGDILLKPGSHVELYLGNDKCVAAHDDYDGKSGDGNGKEIEVRTKNYCSFCKQMKYTLILRYETQPQYSNYSYSFNYNLNGGTGSTTPFSVKYGQTITVTSNSIAKTGYKLAGWNVKRNTDNKWYIAGVGWCSDSTISSNGYTKKVYSSGGNYTLDDSWINGTNSNVSYTFYALWYQTRQTMLYCFMTPCGSGYNHLEAKNNKTTEGYAQQEIYFWYVLYDDYTGDLLNTYSSKKFSAEMTIYNPDGTVAHSHTYTTSDSANWIGLVPKQEGKYIAEVKIISDNNVIGELNTYYNVSYDSILQCSDQSVSLHLNKINTATLTFTLSGSYPEKKEAVLDIDRSVVEVTSTSFKNNVVTVELKGIKVGDTTARVAIVEKYSGNRKEVAAVSVPVTVNANTYTITYDSNGGINAPESQNKFFGTDIILSNTIPVRSGYSFLGWSQSKTANTPDYISGDKYSENQDITLYAVWKESTCMHTYSYIIVSSATCTSSGALKWTCSKCGNVYIENTPALGHSYGSWTKLNDTQHQRVCSRNSSHIEKANHTWNSGTVTKAVTCTASGIKTYSCASCNTTKTETIAALGHSYGAWTKLNDTQHQRVCSRDSSHVEKANHTWNAGTVTKAATCVATGMKTYTCTVCKATKAETIAVNASNHVNKTNTAATASTCTVKGYTAGAYCNDCKKYISGHAEQPLAAHKTTTQNAKAATCTAEGYTGDQVCTVCKQTITKGTAIAKKAHTLTTVNQKNAGCTTAGYTGDQVCTTCNQTITKGSAVAALGHANADSNGNCTRCGQHIKDVTPSQPSNPQPNPNACKYCGQVHTGPFGWLIKFFHSILAIFKR